VAQNPVINEVAADGKITWTLYMDRIVRDEDGVMEIASPSAVYRLESGEVLEVKGDNGTYDETNRVLTLNGNVSGNARNSTFGFTTGKIVWNNLDGLLHATGGVKIFRDGMSLTGEELSMNLTRDISKFELTGGVEITSSSEIVENPEILSEE
jgi:hypothetical protein